MKSYRDKFVAHLDLELDGYDYPTMDCALLAAKNYYEYLIKKLGFIHEKLSDQYM